MEFQDTSLRVELPHEVVLRWQTLRRLYKTLRDVKETNSLIAILLQVYKASGHDLFSDQHNTVPSVNYAEWNPFSGLKTYLDKIAKDIERKCFFQMVLPVIISLASQLDRYAPSQGLQISCRQNPLKTSLSKDFEASILASSFLCAMPPCSSSVNIVSVDFVKLYGNIERPELKDNAVAKLRNVLEYFEKIGASVLDLKGEVVFERQVAIKSSFPSIDDWENSAAVLCPLTVDQRKAKHSRLLSPNGKQDDICGCFGDVLVKKDTSVEALIASLFVEELDDNEILIIKDNTVNGHVERLVSWTSSSSEKQWCGLVLSYLNKALICFDNQYSKCGIQYVQDNSLDINSVDEDEERLESRQETDFNDNITIPGIDIFCDSLVDQAYNQARNEIDVASTMTSEDKGDVLETLMMKSLREVFQETPEREKMFSDSIINSPLLPKCLKHFHSNCDFNSPLIPSPPPSSPVKRGLVANGRQSLLMSTSPLVDEFKLGSKSFADSLAEALMSCVLLSSSLATSIATDALDSLSITSVTMEMFQKSPKILEGSKNGRVSATPRNCSSEAIENGKSPNYFDDSSFCLAINKEEDPDLSSLSSDASSFDSEVDHEERRRSLNELALSLFENFASKLSRSIIQTAAQDIVGEMALESIDEEPCNDCEPSDDALSCDEENGYRCSDSDSDFTYNDRDDTDIDRQLEDKLYALDLIENEEYTIGSQRTVSKLALDMTLVILHTAVSAAAAHLEALDDASQGEGCIDDNSVIQYKVRNDSALESSYQEMEDIEILASGISTNIIQGVLEDTQYCGVIKPTSQGSNDLESISAERNDSDPEGFNDSCSTQSTEIIQYAEVLTEQLVESGVAIAGVACSTPMVFRPIATNRWYCQGSAIGVQMEAILQWLAASVAGCPAVTFFSFRDKKLAKFSKVQQTLRENNCTVHDVLEVVLRCSPSDRSDSSCDLFKSLLGHFS